MGTNKDEFIEHEYLIEAHPEMREEFKWGSFGTTGTEERQDNRIKDLSDAHIYNILTTQRLTRDVQNLMVTELYFRLSGRANGKQRK